MRNALIGILTGVLVGLTTPALAQDDQTPCRGTEVGRALDFWIGSWRVTSVSGEQSYGENDVTWDAGGCAIHEFWESADGTRGTSLFYFAINEQVWHQVWVSSDTSLPWGLKHKDMVSRAADGTLQFQGVSQGEDGPYFDRTTLSPLDDGSVRQVIEISTDEGATWRQMFEAIYHPVGED